MIQFFESEGMSILLAAPTGRAAKRMTEATGYEAQTIHRLLEVSGNPEEEGNVNGFMRNRQNPLETDVLIIDEMSMVDLPLMHALLSAVVEGTRLILVGDVNQLPSVGPGSVLKDIIASVLVSGGNADKIFRQAGESDIVVNAHKINAGGTCRTGQQEPGLFLFKTAGSRCDYQCSDYPDSEEASQVCGCTAHGDSSHDSHKEGTAGGGAAECNPQEVISIRLLRRKRKRKTGKDCSALGIK